MQYRKYRKPTDYGVILCAESGDYDVIVRNVTDQGVNVSGLGGIVFPDAEVDLVVRKQKFPGWISWVHEDTAGVKLKHPLPSDIEQLLGRGVGVGRAGLRGAARW